MAGSVFSMIFIQEWIIFDLHKVVSPFTSMHLKNRSKIHAEICSWFQDDFLCTLDLQTASALCTSLSRYWRSDDNKGSGPALLATCKVGLIPFLQPDVVLHLLGVSWLSVAVYCCLFVDEIFTSYICYHIFPDLFG